MRTHRATDAAIVMFGDGRDWHGRSLTRAFKRRGITPLLAPLNECEKVELDDSKFKRGLVFDGDLPL